MEPIRYRAGQPETFTSTRPFALGTTGITVPRGAEVLFDGTKVTVDGSEYSVPQLRGAVKAGWLVPAGSFDDTAAVSRPSANIRVTHPTQGGNSAAKAAMATTVSEEERHIATIHSHAERTKIANKSYVRGQTQVNASVGQQVLTQRGMMTVEVQDGQVVDRAPLRTPAGERARQLKIPADAASIVESELSKIRIEPVAGVTREELLERMSLEEQADYLSRIESNKAAYVDAPPVVARPLPERTVVGSVQSKAEDHREGMSFKNSVGGGIDIADPTGLGGKAKEDVTVQDGITFRTVNGPKREASKSGAEAAPAPVASPQVAPEVRLKVAQALCPDFPGDYNFALPDKKRLARIQADYEERPDVLRAIFAAENDSFRAKLIAEFPAVFAGSLFVRRLPRTETRT